MFGYKRYKYPEYVMTPEDMEQFRRRGEFLAFVIALDEDSCAARIAQGLPHPLEPLKTKHVPWWEEPAWNWKASKLIKNRAGRVCRAIRSNVKNTKRCLFPPKPCLGIENIPVR
jgi:hypothetical protein